MAAITDEVMHAAIATRNPQDLVDIAERYSANLPCRPKTLRPRPQGKDVVLVTGTTGNLGCDLLESLLGDDDVGLVYAVNRRGSQALERQKAAFRAREMDEELLNSPRFRLVEGDLMAPGLGLDSILLEEIRNTVTCMIHNAWRVNFNMPMHSFDVYLRSLRDLVELALSCPYDVPPKIQYVGSVTVFQSCPHLSSALEEPVSPEFALGTGYGESKWVGEKMLMNVADRTAVPVQIVRLAQICGDRNWYWNEAEWFPSMVKSAALTRCLPDVDGDAGFVPNYAAARALVEMRSSPERILHLTHPRPSRMRSILAATAEELDIPLVSYREWLRSLSRCAKSLSEEKSREDYISSIQKNPALILLGFFCTRKFTRGNEITQLLPLSTEKAQVASPTLKYLPELEDDISMRWLEAWRDAGFLEYQ